MAFVILDTRGELLRDGAGELIVLRTPRGAEKWRKAGETVRPLEPETDQFYKPRLRR